MFRTNLKAGLRNFWKNKSYSFLNILGLAIGIACAGLIFLWVEDQTTFDQVHVKKDRICLVMNNFQIRKSDQKFKIGINIPSLHFEVL
jgi:hypothetical protein